MKVLVLAFAILNCTTLLFADDPPFGGAPEINSWYGPRIHPVPPHPFDNLHNGVDYPKPFGTPILAVASGTVTIITYLGKENGGYGIYFTSGGKLYGHLHIFQELSPGTSLPILLSNGWELFRSNNILKIRRPALTVNGQNFPSRVFSTALSERQISLGEPIAPVGISGIGTGPHLHLTLTNGADNPLNHVTHTEGPPAINFLTLTPNQVLNDNQLENFLVSFQVDSNPS